MAIERAAQEILLNRLAPSPRGLATKEVLAQTIAVSNPRARICTSRFRNLNPAKLFGRFFWEVAGREDLESISYYDSSAVRFAKGDRIPTAYGKRLLSYGKSDLDQVGRGIETLKADPASRRATGLILTPIDNPSTTREYPCVVGYQTLVREDYLHMIVFVRSSSVWAVFPIDFFLFSMLQEIIAAELGIEVGTISFMIGSMHFYKQDLESINLVMNHGMMAPTYEMGPLFTEHSPKLEDMIDAEQKIRKHRAGFNFDPKLMLRYKDEEWAQMLHALIVYRNILDKEDVGRLPSYLALNPTYKMMITRHIPKKKEAKKGVTTTTSKPIRREPKGADNKKSKLEKQSTKRAKKKATRVPSKPTSGQGEGQEVENTSGPSGWVS